MGQIRGGRRTSKFYIDGKWSRRTARRPSTSEPGNEEVIGTITLGDQEDETARSPPRKKFPLENDRRRTRVAREASSPHTRSGPDIGATVPEMRRIGLANMAQARRTRSSRSR
jgi:hypothetical protein